MGKKGVRRVGLELDFKGKTAEQLKKEVDKKLDLYFKRETKEVEGLFGKVNLPLDFYRDMELEKQRLKRFFYEKIDAELYMDRISAAFDYKGDGKGKY